MKLGAVTLVSCGSLDLLRAGLYVEINRSLEVGQSQMPAFLKLGLTEAGEFAEFDSCVTRLDYC
jgi:hypothetical protein